MRIGARHQCKDVRFGCIRNVALGAVDDVVIAFFLSARGKRSRIGARTRFSQRKRTNDFPGGKPRQIFLFLRFRAINNDTHAADTVVGAHDRTKHRRRFAQRHAGERLFLGGKPKPAVFLGNRQAKQTHAPHLGDDVGGDFIRLGDFTLARNEFFAHQARDGIEEDLEGGGVADHKIGGG